MNRQWSGPEPNNLFGCPILGYSLKTEPRFNSGNLHELSLFSTSIYAGSTAWPIFAH
ncbi:hypothetical protein B9Z19DRAFT_1090878 [Tuber borchii]|uniref:Uncharacterized protein n=1 Tax=Tuber borchii TaxID=42251 RepID=A0A2T6ZIA0_TUBBO|nr:hypothetical protein B9Z19DRAFT_1090878 [Tuber borchii]